MKGRKELETEDRNREGGWAQEPVLKSSQRDGPASVIRQGPKGHLTWLRDENAELSDVHRGGRVDAGTNDLWRGGGLQGRACRVQGKGWGRLQGGKGAGRSSGKKSVKSSVRTSRKRQPFGRPLAKII